MNLRSMLGQYLLAMLVFLVLDLVWLGVVAQDLYDRELGGLLAEDPNVAAAGVFYALFVAGLLFFVVRPALEAGSGRDALVRGAAFGLVTYATWDLTGLAVIEGFPVTLALVDMAWGTLLAATVSTATYHGWRRLTRPRP